MTMLKTDYNKILRQKYKDNNKNRIFDEKKKRKCSMCKRELPATPEYFHKDISHKSGLHVWCKECRSKKNKEYRKNNPELIKKKRRENYKKNKKRILGYNSKWQKNNLNKIKIWRDKNPDKQKGYKLKTDFGITINDYNEMLKEQNGVCFICGKSETHTNQFGIVKLSVDHNHKTGKVRSLLCSSCNRTLGAAKENIYILIKMIKYLKKND